MKIVTALSAGLIGAVAMLAPTIGAAQQRHVERRVVVTHTNRVVNNGYRGDHYRNRRVCKVAYRDHRRVRTCRTIRVRY